MTRRGATHCPHFALLAGQKVTLSALGELGPLMKVAETFGDTLRVLETYRRLQSSRCRVQLGETAIRCGLSGHVKSYKAFSASFFSSHLLDGCRQLFGP